MTYSDVIKILVTITEQTSVFASSPQFLNYLYRMKKTEDILHQ